MHLLRAFLVTLALALTMALLSPVPASAIVCHDYPGGCCEDVKVLGKTILHIDC